MKIFTVRVDLIRFVVSISRLLETLPPIGISRIQWSRNISITTQKNDLIFDLMKINRDYNDRIEISKLFELIYY